MDNENQEKIFWADDNQNRIYCDICDKFAIYRYYNNHLKSPIHINNFRKRQ